MGAVAGYISARIYKSKFACGIALCACKMYCVIPVVTGGLKWKSNVLMTAFFVPGCVQRTCLSEWLLTFLSLSCRATFSVFFTLNLFLWGAGSSAAVPFTTLLALLCLWLGISLPLTFFGAFLGFRKPVRQVVHG